MRLNENRREASRFSNVLFVLAGTLVGFLLVETTYRTYLYKTEPYLFLREKSGSFYYFQSSPYRYSQEFGYEYVPGTFVGGSVHKHKVTQCWERIYGINERGNTGRIEGSYEEARLKILVFGDSWTGQPQRELAWPDYLQEELEVSGSVHVVNFGRDAYGLLQMFDLAVAKVPKWSPDLVIFAFITDDLSRDRFWRRLVEVDGREVIATVTSPDLGSELEGFAGFDLVSPESTYEWCREQLAARKTGDRVVRQLEMAALSAQRRTKQYADPFSLSRSFVLELLFHGSAYRDFNILPRHQMRDFAEDQRMVQNINVLKETGMPFLLIHLAYYLELNEEKEYLS